MGQIRFWMVSSARSRLAVGMRRYDSVQQFMVEVHLQSDYNWIYCRKYGSDRYTS